MGTMGKTYTLQQELIQRNLTKLRKVPLGESHRKDEQHQLGKEGKKEFSKEGKVQVQNPCERTTWTVQELKGVLGGWSLESEKFFPNLKMNS